MHESADLQQLYGSMPSVHRTGVAKSNGSRLTSVDTAVLQSLHARTSPRSRVNCSEWMYPALPAHDDSLVVSVNTLGVWYFFYETSENWQSPI